jgi:small-conductance mechanosensitive channel
MRLDGREVMPMPKEILSLPERAAHWFAANGPKIGVVLVVLLLVWVLYRLSRRWLRGYVERRQESPHSAQMLLLLWKYGFLFLGVLVVLGSMAGNLAAIGLSTAFVGMVLGWSLQRPVTGIAAWLALMINRPFRIGDRVIIAGIRGDVVDINLMYTVLGEVGGTIGGEESSGRGVLIPNATLFDQIVYNYAMESDYILDEVPVRVTYESDWATAERVLLQAAREVTQDAIGKTGQEPFLRVEFMDVGILFRLRYQARAVERQRISSDIVKRVYELFAQHREVQFCYPRSEVYYHGGPPPLARAAGD